MILPNLETMLSAAQFRAWEREDLEPTDVRLIPATPEEDDEAKWIQERGWHR